MVHNCTIHCTLLLGKQYDVCNLLHEIGLQALHSLLFLTTLKKIRD